MRRTEKNRKDEIGKVSLSDLSGHFKSNYAINRIYASSLVMAAHYQPYIAKYFSDTNTFVVISISGKKKIEKVFIDQVETVSSDVTVCQTVCSLHFDRSD